MRLAPYLFAAAAAVPASASAVDIVFDYRYDSAGFFDADKRAVLDQVASLFSTNLTDTLLAIQSAGGNRFNAQFFDPLDPMSSEIEQISNFSVAGDEIRIFVGSTQFAGNILAVGGPGAYSAQGSQAFLNTVEARGQAGALAAEPSDFGPWGGIVSFSSTINWYADTDVSTLESFGGRFDLYTVAVHETAHVLGFGTSDSWTALLQGLVFTGELATQVNEGAAVGIANDGSEAHLAASLRGIANGVEQSPLLAPQIAAGQRKYMTDLDWAVLSDIGWEVASLQATVPVAAIPEPASWAMLAGGLLLVGMTTRRRV